MDKGIDYGRGMVNINHNTGIRFGVINQSELLQAWADESVPRCSNCCCNTDDIVCECEPDGFEYIGEGYEAFQSFDDTDIFVVESPYYTLCAYCSPCAPGAGYVMDQVEDGVKAYCFGHDWFEGGRAPYKVYDVKTGNEV